MSSRYQAGIVLPGYNALKVANAPTIGTATVASGTSVSVAFTAPSCVGGGAISSYTAFANCGLLTASGASSPLTVTGLTTGTTYTFKVIATNVFGPSYPSAASNSATPVAIGQDAYTSAGTFSWVAPSGVTSVSVVTVAGGGGGGMGAGSRFGSGGGAGALAYTNNVSVTPGNTYTLIVGSGGPGRASTSGSGSGTNGGFSRFIGNACATVRANGGTAGTYAGCSYSPGGTVSSGTGGSGGCGGRSSTSFVSAGGGGGAGGYSGNGGRAGGAGCSFNTFDNGQCGSGGGGGGGTNASGGGGVGLLGQGSNGVGGTYLSGNRYGSGGSGGSSGTQTSFDSNGKPGGNYGGGGGGARPCVCGCGITKTSGAGAGGAVRIIYPGTTRSFPSTCTGNL